MFAPPVEIETTVFAEFPERFQETNRASEWVRVMRHGTPTPSFLEGPAFDRDGNLYFVNIPYGQIYRSTPNGDISLVAEYDGEPNGLAIHADGSIYIADYRNGIMVLDPSTGEVRSHLDRAHAESFKGCNDLTFHSDGSLWFTDQGLTGLHDPTGRVYAHNDNDHALKQILNTVPSPNGLAFSPDEKILYVAATRGNAIWRVPVLPHGSINKVGIFVQLSGGLAGPDGVAVDASGNLFVAHAGLGIVWGFDRLGIPKYLIRSCAGLMTTNCAFGVRDGDKNTLYITESETGQILTAKLESEGQPLFSHS
ncbi:gluconolactonase [Thioclava sp. F34-6]|uniref:SMP-30/gluconolactonase/LRE family protein n=1 Tax=Thioclava sp. F34-6 TaxID=1973003 RepID=UPI000B544EFB|nr:SMP-30/gluconolactonase/LRE family protein [Thioclava sp. F34-6]OWY08859.1 gluconolactonase [Thioclava sp. F34-6]